MKGEGRQFVTHARRVMLALTGGAGYGEACHRVRKMIESSMIHGHISAGVATADNDFCEADSRKLAEPAVYRKAA